MKEVYFGIDKIKNILREAKPSRLCLVTSTILFEKLAWAREELEITRDNCVLVPDGEAAKEWSEIENLLKKFIECNLDRKSIVVILGGGSVGDAAAFAASIYLRGIRHVHVPTTLVSQVDSAFGGKTGINFLSYKNQIGTFHDSYATVIDTRFLQSLKEEQVVDGLGEIIKAGFIRDTALLDLLAGESVRTLQKSSRLEEIVKRAVDVKRYYVEQDKKDDAQRQILNVGHTIGHAVELKYKISHGRAVLIGMMRELELCEMLGITPPAVRQHLAALLQQLAIVLETEYVPEWEIISRDKKVNGESIVLPVVEREGVSKLITLNLSEFKNCVEKLWKK